MLVNTRDFGEINISEDEILDFPDGIYAFEDDHRFVLISPCGDNKYPMWLQSIDNVNVCFILFNPFEFDKDYSITVEESDAARIDAGEDTPVSYFVIAVVPSQYVDTTVNMKSPILINNDNHKGMQVIAPENYPIKFPAFKKEEE